MGQDIKKNDRPKRDNHPMLQNDTTNKHIFGLYPEGGGRGPGPSSWKITPSSARQRNAIEMAFRWQGDGGPHRILVRTHLPSVNYDD